MVAFEYNLRLPVWNLASQSKVGSLLRRKRASYQRSAIRDRHFAVRDLAKLLNDAVVEFITKRQVPEHPPFLGGAKIDWLHRHFVQPTASEPPIGSTSRLERMLHLLV